MADQRFGRIVVSYEALACQLTACLVLSTMKLKGKSEPVSGRVGGGGEIHAIQGPWGGTSRLISFFGGTSASRAGTSILSVTAPHSRAAPWRTFQISPKELPLARISRDSTALIRLLLFLFMSSRNWQVSVLKLRDGGKWTMVGFVMGQPCFPRLLPRNIAAVAEPRRDPWKSSVNQWCTSTGFPCSRWDGPGSPRLPFTQDASVPGHVCFGPLECNATTGFLSSLLINCFVSCSSIFSRVISSQSPTWAQPAFPFLYPPFWDGDGLLNPEPGSRCPFRSKRR